MGQAGEQKEIPHGQKEKRREDWQQPTDSGSGRPSRTTPKDLDDVETDDPSRPGRKPNPTGLQA
jgi:hypothetical protein